MILFVLLFSASSFIRMVSDLKKKKRDIKKKAFHISYPYCHLFYVLSRHFAICMSPSFRFDVDLNYVNNSFFYLAERFMVSQTINKHVELNKYGKLFLWKVANYSFRLGRPANYALLICIYTITRILFALYIIN